MVVTDSKASLVSKTQMSREVVHFFHNFTDQTLQIYFSPWILSFAM